MKKIFRTGIASHLGFMLASATAFMVLFALLRLALLWYNAKLIGDATVSDLAEAFVNGARFDAKVVVFICLPLLFALFSLRAMAARRTMCLWLTAAASLIVLLGVAELDFYREFQQRLNGLVFQYMSEDPETVLSMLWHGFPVLRYLLAWIAVTALLYLLFRLIERATRRSQPVHSDMQLTGPRLWTRTLAFCLCFVLMTIAARGTLRSGPPLRWGDAFTTHSAFANELGLNGVLTLYDAAESRLSPHSKNTWASKMPIHTATDIVRGMLLTPEDRLVDADSAPIRRDYTPAPEGVLPAHNVVVILMERFAAQHVGALGSQDDITPNFDALTKEGLLFRNFFSNGTHTHQGLFATMACFPNLPSFEYLMQTTEGRQQFSGLPQLLSARGYEDFYVYNGDFAWDNQAGFFGQQGMRTFIGRNDYVNPVVSDPTWGVSDQDMFDRAAKELDEEEKDNDDKPFYALLQTLSNHTPFPLPETLPVEPVTRYDDSLNKHLTAMRYSDWALGRFFEQARRSPYFKDTLFVVLGDHGFTSNKQVTELNLYSFHVPLLLIGPGVRETFGEFNDTVGTQVDVVPTIMGRLGGTVRHQCWGRDLLSLPKTDEGFGVIKPSGSTQTVGLIKGGRILIKAKNADPRLYTFHMGPNAEAVLVEDKERADAMFHELDAFLTTATDGLLKQTLGAE